MCVVRVADVVGMPGSWSVVGNKDRRWDATGVLQLAHNLSSRHTLQVQLSVEEDQKTC
jgi:hypothetical protein